MLFTEDGHEKLNTNTNTPFGMKGFPRKLSDLGPILNCTPLAVSILLSNPEMVIQLGRGSLIAKP